MGRLVSCAHMHSRAALFVRAKDTTTKGIEVHCGNRTTGGATADNDDDNNDLETLQVTVALTTVTTVKESLGTTRIDCWIVPLFDRDVSVLRPR